MEREKKSIIQDQNDAAKMTPGHVYSNPPEPKIKNPRAQNTQHFSA